MPVQKTEAIVLRTINSTESSRIITFLSPTEGKVRAVAKGVRRIKNSFGSSLEPITHSDIVYYDKATRSLQTISQATIRRSFVEIKEDLNKLGCASVLLELTEHFAQEREESLVTFRLLEATLDELSRVKDNFDALLLAFELRLLAIYGLRPELELCGGCHVAVETAASFHTAQGGILCRGCAPGGGRKLSLSGLKTLQKLSTIELRKATRIRIQPRDKDNLTGILRDFIEYHLERKLKSADFLLSLSAKHLPG